MATCLSQELPSSDCSGRALLMRLLRGYRRLLRRILELGVIGAGIGGGVGGFIFFQAGIAVARKHYREILLGEDPESRETPHA